MSRRITLWLLVIALCVLTAIAAALGRSPAPPPELTQLLWPAILQSSAAVAIAVVIIRIVEELRSVGGGGGGLLVRLPPHVEEQQADADTDRRVGDVERGPVMLASAERDVHV